MSPEKKQRLDQLLVERGLAESRAKAQALVLAGQVFSGERRLDKPGQGVPADLALEVRTRKLTLRLAAAGRSSPTAWIISASIPTGMVALDLGASTGGFTDVLLQRGATKVYAVDVGHGQLDWRLRNDPQRRRAGADQRPLPDRDLIPEPLDLVVCDASFISPETRPSGGASTDACRRPRWSP